MVVPIQLLGALILLSTIDDPELVGGFGDPEAVQASDSELAGAIAGNVAVGLLGGLAVLLATAACLKAVGDAYLASTPDWRESLRMARRRIWSLLWFTILYTILLIPAFLLLLVPGIWLAIAWIVALPALMTEGIGARKALGRSFRLVRKRWWPTFGVIAIAYVLAGVVQFLVGIIVGLTLVFGVEDSVLGTVLVSGTGNVIAGVLTTPFVAAIVVLVYFDLRVRKEGLDIRLLAENVGLAPPAGGTVGREAPPGPVLGQTPERPGGQPPPE